MNHHPYCLACGQRPRDCACLPADAMQQAPKPIHPQATMPPMLHGINVVVHDGYTDLFCILHRALDQAQQGKGHERHAAGRDFIDQPIMSITRGRGFGFPFGQVEKKIDEADGMIQRGELKAAERELLGAINYIAAAVIRIHEIEAKAD